MADRFTITISGAFRTSFRTLAAGARERVVVFTGGMPGSEHQCVYKSPRMVQLVEPGQRWQDAKVFTVALSKEQHERWPMQPQVFEVVAMSIGSAKSYLEKRFGAIADKMVGTAQSALGAAMEKVSSKPPSSVKGATVKARRTAYANTFVIERTAGKDGFMLDIRDNIDYARLALKSQDAVNIAMKKAANKISSVINTHCKKMLGFEKLPTPFPEVRRRRKAV